MSNLVMSLELFMHVSNKISVTVFCFDFFFNCCTLVVNIKNKKLSMPLELFMHTSNNNKNVATVL